MTTGTREGKIKRQRTYRAANPDKVLNKKLKWLFGITLDQYKQMLFDQGGVCAICGNVETMVNPGTGKVNRLSVDHNHTTGKVRGLLCSAHNTMIARADDRIEILESANSLLA